MQSPPKDFAEAKTFFERYLAKRDRQKAEDFIKSPSTIPCNSILLEIPNIESLRGHLKTKWQDIIQKTHAVLKETEFLPDSIFGIVADYAIQILEKARYIECNNAIVCPECRKSQTHVPGDAGAICFLENAGNAGDGKRDWMLNRGLWLDKRLIAISSRSSLILNDELLCFQDFLGIGISDDLQSMSRIITPKTKLSVHGVCRKHGSLQFITDRCTYQTVANIEALVTLFTFGKIAEGEVSHICSKNVP